ncbi:MAG TPA: SGNH/GDSL hydrolase family protein [Candidatus Saccharibacteria bacterium]|nr:SGNH/GDSL hydrolase family protein [Candidatus Saccharibacteria bacterium]
MRILLFGDSITYGAWDSEGGWADRLKRWVHHYFLETNNKLQVINLGIGGDTSRKVLGRIEQEVQARYSPGWPFLFVFMFGTNDGRMRDGVTEVPIEEFTENYRKTIAYAKTFTEKIILVGLPPLGKAELDFKDMVYSDDVVRSYDAVVRDIATTENIPFVDVRQLFSSEDLFYSDMLHPNDKGHEIIYRAVKTVVEESLENS